MRYGTILLYLLTILANLIPWKSQAQAAPLTIEPQKQWHYAQQLYEAGQHRRAAEEFDRFAFFFPDDPRHRNAVFNAGRSFLMARESMTALQRFHDLMEDEGEVDDLAEEAHFKTAECYLMIDRPNQAVAQLNRLITRSNDMATKDRAYLRTAWILIDRHDWQGARHTLAHISPAGHERLDIAELDNNLARADDIPRKSPALAGVLSIVPGGGQLYCGRHEDALAALVVNGGLFWAAYESFDHDLNALGGMIALVGLGFYTANIYGAVSDAHKYNFGGKKGFAEFLKQNVRITIGHSGVSSTPARVDAIAMTFHFKF